MAFCSNCGRKIEEGVRFCSDCGRAIDGVSKNNATSQSGVNYRLIAKGLFLLVFIGFFMPMVSVRELFVALDMNGLQLAQLAGSEDSLYIAFFLYAIFISSIIGLIIGALLLMKQPVPLSIDWIVSIFCFLCTFTVILFLFSEGIDEDDFKYFQSGVYVILMGVILEMIAQIASAVNTKKTNILSKTTVSNNAPGYKFLKITSILFIVFGVFGILSTIIGMYSTSESEIPAISGFTNFFNVLNAILSLFLGIKGVLYCNDIKKAKLLKYFAFGYIGFYVISSINAVINIGVSLNINTDVPLAVAVFSMIFGIIGMIIGLGIPILYLIGAQKNFKAQEGQLNILTND